MKSLRTGCQDFFIVRIVEADWHISIQSQKMGKYMTAIRHSGVAGTTINIIHVQLKAQYELQCEKDNTDDKKELLEAKRRMMDLDDLIKGLYENFTLGRLPERQFNRLMTEYDTEQSSLEQRISELETATERISTKAVQIDKFVRLVKKYRDFEELTTPMLNDFIEKVVIHEAEGGRTKDRTQQVDIYFNFIGNFVLPLSEDEVEALQSEEARRAEEIAERERKSSKKSTQKRNQKPEIRKHRASLQSVNSIR